MARNKLTKTRVDSNLKPGLHSDGDGLYLRVTKTGTRSWAFVFIRDGKRREMGLGAYGRGTATVSLTGARAKAEEVRVILGRGGNPFTEMAERQKPRNVASFAEIAERLLASKLVSFRNDKHKAQWQMTLGDAYCSSIRALPVDAVTTEHVVAILEPEWIVKHETLSRLRGRIERVLDYARVEGLRDGENPARWRGHLEHRLPRPEQRLSRGHHAAMPWPDLPAFMKLLRDTSGTGARALELTILTAARTGESISATWSEIDWDAAVWTVPGDRMKAGRPHRVPLTGAAVAVLRHMREVSTGDYVFTGRSGKQPISNMTMAKTLKSLDAGAYTVHGFRSAFRDWAGEATQHQREVIEAALAHVVGDAVERAYRRGDALAKRRALMDDWAAYLAGGTKSGASDKNKST